MTFLTIENKILSSVYRTVLGTVHHSTRCLLGGSLSPNHLEGDHLVVLPGKQRQTAYNGLFW